MGQLSLPSLGILGAGPGLNPLSIAQHGASTGGFGTRGWASDGDRHPIPAHPPFLPPHTNSWLPDPARCLPCIPPPKPAESLSPTPVPTLGAAGTAPTETSSSGGLGPRGVGRTQVQGGWGRGGHPPPNTHNGRAKLWLLIPDTGRHSTQDPHRLPCSQRNLGSRAGERGVCFTPGDPGTQQQDGRAAFKPPGQAAAAAPEG